MRYRLEGLDCPSCAAKAEEALRRAGDLGKVSISFATKSIDLDPSKRHRVQEVIDRLLPGVRIVPDERPAAELPDNRPLWVFALSLVLLILAAVLEERIHRSPFPFLEYPLFLVPYFLAGSKVIHKAATNVVRGRVFDENSLMTLATVGAMAIHELPEAVAVMLFYYIGEYFQDRAVDTSRRSIKALMDVRPDFARILREGREVLLSPEEVPVGERILVRPGERIPLDGTVVSGEALLDTSVLTGESLPRRAAPGDSVLSGSISTDGALEIETSLPFRESSMARILDLVEHAASRKAPTEQFITRFARYYTPTVVAAAGAVAFVPPLFFEGAQFSDWAYRALILLVISCPCALVVSIPLGYFGGVGAASRSGILVKGANFLDALAKVEAFVFDKTGTLTHGRFEVTSVETYNGADPGEVLRLTALAEAGSNHPLARAVVETYGSGLNGQEVTDIREARGLGITAEIDGQRVAVGNERLMAREGIEVPSSPDGTAAFVAVGGRLVGLLRFGDEVKPEAAPAIARLKRLGVAETIMLTGDRLEAAAAAARVAGVDRFHAGLLPEDKVGKIEELIEKGKTVAFVGDGINDAPVISRADIGIAMGGLGSDAAIEAADVVIMEDDLSRLPEAVRLARYTRRIVFQNIVLALGVKSTFILFGVIGSATMWEAVFADVGVALLAVLNSMRVLRTAGGRSDRSTRRDGRRLT